MSYKTYIIIMTDNAGQSDNPTVRNQDFATKRICVTPSTHNRLFRLLNGPGDTYENVVTRLLDEAEKKVDK